jgi:hypothetical protein
MTKAMVATGTEMQGRRATVTPEAAAELLRTSPMTLGLWEERFGYPVPVRSAVGEPMYCENMMVALRDALRRELSISSAISEARRVEPAHRGAHPGGMGPPDWLVASLENPG